MTFLSFAGVEFHSSLTLEKIEKIEPFKSGLVKDQTLYNQRLDNAGLNLGRSQTEMREIIYIACKKDVVNDIYEKIKSSLPSFKYEWGAVSSDELNTAILNALKSSEFFANADLGHWLTEQLLIDLIKEIKKDKGTFLIANTNSPEELAQLRDTLEGRKSLIEGRINIADDKEKEKLYKELEEIDILLANKYSATSKRSSSFSLASIDLRTIIGNFINRIFEGVKDVYKSLFGKTENVVKTESIVETESEVEYTQNPLLLVKKPDEHSTGFDTTEDQDRTQLMAARRNHKVFGLKEAILATTAEEKANKEEAAKQTAQKGGRFSTILSKLVRKEQQVVVAEVVKEEKLPPEVEAEFWKLFEKTPKTAEKSTDDDNTRW